MIVDQTEVIEKWALLCDEHRDYFQRFYEAVNAANKMSVEKYKLARSDEPVVYGQRHTNAELIGAWCQDFWEALPDHPYIHGPSFYVVCDIAEWYCLGDE